MSMKILLDTDIGSDIDDAVCLAYLLAQPKCELLGITTVSGEPGRRAMLASALCHAAGKPEIPIYPGSEHPLLSNQRQPRSPQSDALARWPHATEFARGEAVEFLRRTIRANPGEITLLAIGPMTNIALLFKADDEIPSLLKSLVLMCGDFVEGEARPEWNAICDPHAAAIVYQAAVQSHRSLGLNVTNKVKMAAGEVRERFTPPLLQPVRDFAEIWFQQREQITFHDPLAAVTIFDDQICSFGTGNVSVTLGEEPAPGATGWQPANTDPKHQVGIQVDSQRFFEHYFSVFGE